MNFLENIFERLSSAGDAAVLQEIHPTRVDSVSGNEFLARVAQARVFIVGAGLKSGDRCALLGPNSIRWVAVDLALMAEGITVVPLYSRQAPAELVTMMKDCSPALSLCATPELRDAIAAAWTSGPPAALFDEIFAGKANARVVSSGDESVKRVVYKAVNPADPITIIYTSGTS